MSLMTSLRSGRRVGWSRVLGLILVPLTVAGVLLWGLWNPQDRLDSVTAAVVNLDEPVELDGQTVPLGRVLSGELIDGDAEQNFTWVLTDEEDAEAGLDDGRYATVVTIPENFSAAATSLSGDDPAEAERATIDIAESDSGRLIDTALSGIVTSTATNVLNRQLGEQFVGGVFVGMTELGHGIGDAADGATRLAAGGKTLADGTGQLAQGTQELASGAGSLSSGAGTLSSGAAELAGGVGQYVAGAGQLASAYRPLGEGAAAAAGQLKTMIGALGALQAESAGPQGQVEQGLTTVGTVMSPENPAGFPAGIVGLVTDCYASGAAPEFCEQLQAQLTGYAGSIGGGMVQVQGGMQGLAAAQANFQNTVTAGQGGGEGDPTAQLDELIGGLSQFGTGLDTLAAQGAQLASGASQLSSGAAQLASGTAQLATGTSELAANTPQLADGAAQLADGTSSLASGLDEAASQVPDYTEAERDRIASTALAPVEATGASDELFNSSGVPLFAGIALWAGALAMFLLLAPMWSRTREAARGVGAITLRSALPAVMLGAVQGVLAGVILPIALGYDFSQGLRFFGVAVLAGIAFGLIVQGLSALLGGLGRFVAFALLVVAFAAGIVSTAPAALAAIGDASPIGAALGGFQAVANGAAVGGSVFVLVLWGLGGLALTALAVARERRAR